MYLFLNMLLIFMLIDYVAFCVMAAISLNKKLFGLFKKVRKKKEKKTVKVDDALADNVVLPKSNTEW